MDKDEKILFITMLGQATFARLKDLPNPQKIKDIPLKEIADLLFGHYRHKTIQIAKF